MSKLVAADEDLPAWKLACLAPAHLATMAKMRYLDAYSEQLGVLSAGAADVDATWYKLASVLAPGSWLNTDADEDRAAERAGADAGAGAGALLAAAFSDDGSVED